MKSKNIFQSLFILVFLLTSCGQESVTSVPVTQTSTAAQQQTAAPSATLLALSPLPTVSFGIPSSTPYPNAETINANAVAFIAENALWVANVDGSGEKKLVEIIRNKVSYDAQVVQWSPDGEWISYFSQDKLWAVSRDGLTKKSLLSLPDKSVANLIRYAWSPDSSKIAYLELSFLKPTITPTPRPEGGESGLAPYFVGIIDIATGNISELSPFEANAGIPTLSWSPNGRDLLFIKDYSLVMFDVAANKIVKTIKRGCGLERGLSWSPNGKWFSYTDNGVGGFNPTWICVNSATGDSIQTVRVDSTSFNPVWDKTGNYIFFLAAKIDLTRKSDWLIDEQLMRYDARTQKTESLLSLKELQHPNSYIRYLSISPDGNTLMLQAETSQTKLDLIFIDIQSLTTTKSTIDFGPLPNDSYPHITTCGWSPDSKSVIFFFTQLYWVDQTWGSYDYGYFYALDISTGKISVFSGIHQAKNVQISPIATTP